MKYLEFISYSDIHWDKFSNGITLDDFDVVEDQIRQESIARNKCPILFAGDRFVDSNPLDEVKNRADAAMLRKEKDDIKQIILVGNHDMWYKAVTSGHTYAHVDLYPNEYKNVTIMDKVGLYEFGDFGVHAIPAGGFANNIEFVFNDYTNICVFHDIYKNSVVNQQHNIRLEGTAHEVMDRREFDFILGGDNHVPQQLPLENTVGIHIGSTLQHNWGDCGSPRGFWSIVVDNEGPKFEFHESKAPKFLRYVFTVEDPNTFNNWVLDQLRDVSNNIVRLHLQGLPDVINKIDKDSLEREIKSKYSPRRIQTVLEPWIKRLSISDKERDIVASKTYEQRWDKYVDIKGFDDPQKYKSLGHELINKAKS